MIDAQLLEHIASALERIAVALERGHPCRVCDGEEVHEEWCPKKPESPGRQPTRESTTDSGQMRRERDDARREHCTIYAYYHPDQSAHRAADVFYGEGEGERLFGVRAALSREPSASGPEVTENEELER